MMRLGELLVGGHMKALGGWSTQGGHGGSVCLCPLTFPPCISSTWLLLTCILYNELIIASEVLF